MNVGFRVVNRLLNPLDLEFKCNLKNLQSDAKTQELQNKWNQVCKGFQQIGVNNNNLESKKPNNNRCEILQERENKEEKEDTSEGKKYGDKSKEKF